MLDAAATVSDVSTADAVALVDPLEVFLRRAQRVSLSCSRLA